MARAPSFPRKECYMRVAGRMISITARELSGLVSRRDTTLAILLMAKRLERASSQWTESSTKVILSRASSTEMESISSETSLVGSMKVSFTRTKSTEKVL